MINKFPFGTVICNLGCSPGGEEEEEEEEEAVRKTLTHPELRAGQFHFQFFISIQLPFFQIIYVIGILHENKYVFI